MDSMRSLDTSLPGSSNRQRRNRHPSPELLAGFKSAALSLTNFYKTALADQKKTRNSGYQDALEDLINYLDQENIGVGDGEGWMIRQWATARFEGMASQEASQAESEDDNRQDAEQEARSSSPSMQPKSEPSPIEQVSTSPHRVHPVPPTPASTVKNFNPPSNSDMFTFRSSVLYPQQSTSNSESGEQPVNSIKSAVDTPTPHTPSFRLELQPSSGRLRSKHPLHPTTKMNARQASGSLGAGGGSKRRNPFNEFFDIDFSSLKDTQGSRPKRPRH